MLYSLMILTLVPMIRNCFIFLNSSFPFCIIITYCKFRNHFEDTINVNNAIGWLSHKIRTHLLIYDAYLYADFPDIAKNNFAYIVHSSTIAIMNLQYFWQKWTCSEIQLQICSCNSLHQSLIHPKRLCSHKSTLCYSFTFYVSWFLSIHEIFFRSVQFSCSIYSNFIYFQDMLHIHIISNNI